VFRDETAMLFRNAMCTILIDYYTKIEKRVLLKYHDRNSAVFREVVMRGLRDVFNWLPKEKVFYTQEVIKRHPGLPKLYHHTYLAVLQTFAQKITTPYENYVIPLFEEYYIVVLTKMAMNEYVLRGDLLKDFGTACCIITELLRAAFAECIEYISLKVPLTSENLQLHNTITTKLASTKSSSVQSKTISSLHSSKTESQHAQPPAQPVPALQQPIIPMLVSLPVQMQPVPNPVPFPETKLTTDTKPPAQTIPLTAPQPETKAPVQEVPKPPVVFVPNA
jgi:hypothetical protein